MTPFVPPEFDVPRRLDHALFALRPLVISDVVRDYDAVMTSVARLQTVFGPGSGWPATDLTLEQDLVDLGWHHKEFQRRSSFAYTIVDPPDTLCLGCAYVYPTAVPGYEAEAYCWVRSSHARHLDAPVFQALTEWLRAAWPFRRTAFPGRDLDWPAWANAGGVRR